MILEYGEIQTGFHTSQLSYLDKLLVVLLKLVAKQQTLLIFFQLLEGSVVSKLLPTCLNSEVCLPCSDNWFGRITILHNQVTRVTRELYIRQFPPRARTNRDHCERILEMVINGEPTTCAGFFCSS
ncbi:hypothetical protein FX983_03577 [Pseudomonas frederiksbergensis]|uniref:Uncharacterized protein n=1 Tax=Pseudomonas frederiksbergensis TaxID=104087 RepID=A0A6L5BLI1_9PSED|nr:hypothetical protein FX983_03577 [Pseudomonas frederiksbergensis]